MINKTILLLYFVNFLFKQANALVNQGPITNLTSNGTTSRFVYASMLRSGANVVTWWDGDYNYFSILYPSGISSNLTSVNTQKQLNPDLNANAVPLADGGFCVLYLLLDQNMYFNQYDWEGRLRVYNVLLESTIAWGLGVGPHLYGGFIFQFTLSGSSSTLYRMTPEGCSVRIDIGTQLGYEGLFSTSLYDGRIIISTRMLAYVKIYSSSMVWISNSQAHSLDNSLKAIIPLQNGGFGILGLQSSLLTVVRYNSSGYIQDVTRISNTTFGTNSFGKFFMSTMCNEGYVVCFPEDNQIKMVGFYPNGTRDFNISLNTSATYITCANSAYGFLLSYITEGIVYTVQYNITDKCLPDHFEFNATVSKCSADSTCTSLYGTGTCKRYVSMCNSSFPDFFYNNTCGTCTPPLVAQTTNYPMYCDSPCSSLQFVYPNGTCSSSCISPYVQQLYGGKPFCLSPCQKSQYYYWNATCLDTCVWPLVRYTTYNITYCNSPCLDDEYLFNNGTCSKFCPIPYTKVAIGLKKFCNYGCLKNQYLYFNESCLSTCPFPYVIQNISGDIFCNFPCKATEFLYWTGVCKQNCSKPFTERFDSTYKYCDNPCDINKIIYYNGTCGFNCIFPLNLRPNTLEVCQACDTDKTVCRYGNVIGPKPGYWIYNASANLILECPYPSSCLGNSLNSTVSMITSHGTCAEGYSGNLCANCQENWGHFGTGLQCVPCTNNPGYYVKVTLLMLLNLTIFIYSIFQITKAGQNYNQMDFTQSILIRILLNYFQITSLIGEIEIPWPNSLSELFFYGSQVGSAIQASVTSDCVMVIQDKDLLTFFKLILISISPFMFGGILSLIWLIGLSLKKIDLANFKNRVVTGFVIVIFNMIPGIIKSCLNYFKCKNLYRDDKSISYLALNYDIQCWTGVHFNWLVEIIIPALALWMIIAPTWLLLKLKRNKSKLKQPSMLQRYSFIYNGYKSNFFYWEFVVLLRKIIGISIIVFLGLKSQSLQVFFTLIVTIIFIFIQMLCFPYEDNKLNLIEGLGMTTSAITCVVALYFQVNVSGKSEYDDIFIVLAIAWNALFLVIWLRYFLKSTRLRLKSKQKLKKGVKKIRRYQFLNSLKIQSKEI